MDRLLSERPTVVLVGPRPPPLGGVSVHVQRLQAYLEPTFRVSVLDPFRHAYLQAPHEGAVGSSRGLLTGVRDLVTGRHRLAHVHVSTLRTGALGIRVALALTRGRTGTVLTLHDEALSMEFSNAPVARRAVLGNLIRGFDRVIAVNQALADFVSSLGVAQADVRVIPAFLPESPRPNEGARRAVTRLSEGRRAVVVSGYAQPRWGMHALLDAMDAVPTLKTDLAVILCVYGESDPEYLRDLESRVAGLPAAALFDDLDSAEFTDLIAQCDILARPTTADGDSVAVREAAAAGLQLVASDSVGRPSGSLLFRLGAPQDFADALGEALRNPDAGRIEPALSFGQSVVELYEELLRHPHT